MYFDLLDKILTADKNDDISSLLMHSQGSLGLLESLIKYNKEEYGSFDIKTIPALDKALIYFAVNGNTGQLKNIHDIVNYFKELYPYKDEVDKAILMRDLAAKIYQYVKANPDCIQKDLKKNINYDDGVLIRTTVYYMDKVGKITRRKKGNTYLLKVK